MTGIDRANCSAPHHGKAHHYFKDRCRCDDAREAAKRNRQAWRERRAERNGTTGRLYTSGVGTARRLRALQVAGWPFKDQAGYLDMSPVRVADIVRRVRRGAGVTRGTAQAVRAMYADLGGRDGPAVGAQWCARFRAGREYAPPYAWAGLDIDDPGAGPWWFGWDVDPVAQERAVRWGRGRAMAQPADLAYDDRAAVVRYLLARPNASVWLPRVFAITQRTAERVEARGGVRRRHLARLVINPTREPITEGAARQITEVAA